MRYWAVLALFAWALYRELAPRIVTKTVYEERVKVEWREKECPTIRPCEIIYQEPDKVVVVTQDLPCRCGDSVINPPSEDFE